MTIRRTDASALGRTPQGMRFRCLVVIPALWGKSNWAHDVNMFAQRDIKWLSRNDDHLICFSENGVVVLSSRTSPNRTKTQRAIVAVVGDDRGCALPRRLQLAHSSLSRKAWRKGEALGVLFLEEVFLA